MEEHLLSSQKIATNKNGGIYTRGRAYDISKKSDVLTTYFQLCDHNPQQLPDSRTVAKLTKVSHTFVNKILQEFEVFGHLEDPRRAESRVNARRRQITKINAEAALYLLALRYENNLRPLYSYQRELHDALGLYVSVSTIDRFFKTRFDFAGKLRKPNLVPLNKWKPKNIQAYHKFMETIAQLPNHFKYHFLDEKHIVNKDCIGNRVRADPLTGAVRCIHVTGNFRHAYNMISIISANPGKLSPIDYVLGEDNGMAASFTAYIEHLIGKQWFERGDVLIMDNAAIHTGAEASIVVDLLWTVELDDEPLNVLVVPLPTRAPELNPIELVFHILARRLCLFCY